MMEQKKDTVDLQHADYAATAAFREAYKDVLGGTRALRAKYKQYFPQFPLEHDDDYNALSADDAVDPKNSRGREEASSNWLADVGFERKG